MKKPRVSLTITHPALCEEWSERNFPFGPESEHERSHDRVWWRGKCGHEWMAVVRNRTYGETGCPYCTGTKVLPGFNDLATLYPEVAAEWDREKNGNLRPDQFTAGSLMKIWWICRNGHSWKTTIGNRTHGHDCPICRKEKTVPGINDLATTHPELLASWSDRNDPLKPDEIGMSYSRQLWWKCPDCGNEYQGKILTQLEKQTCPFCSGEIVREQFNDLGTTDPEIAAEWDPDRNGSLDPGNVHRDSRSMIWWRCSKGHSWQASIRERAIEKAGCPVCEGKVQDSIKQVVHLERQITERAEVLSEYRKNKGNIDTMGLVPVWEKYAFNVYEAAKYYGLSVGKLREIIGRNRSAEYLTWKSGHVYIIRKAFDQFLDSCHEV